MILKKIAYYFNQISESMDAEVALKNENQFFSVLASITMYVGSIASFLTLYFVNHEELWFVFKGSFILFLFATSFIVFSHLKNEKLKMYVFAIIISLISVYSFFEYFNIIGPAVSTITFLLLISILIYSRVEVLIIFLITTVILNIFTWKLQSNFTNWDAYYSSHTIIILIISFTVIGVFRVFKSRQKKIIEQYKIIRFSEEKLAATLSSVGDGVITVNNLGKIDYLNPIAENLTGWSLKEAIGQPFEIVFRIINELSREMVESPVEKALLLKEIVKLANHTILVSKDGLERVIEDTAAPIITKEGTVDGVILVFRDISEKKEKHSQIEYLSYHDHLTGLYNRRFFDEELSRLDQERNLPISFNYS